MFHQSEGARDDATIDLINRNWVSIAHFAFECQSVEYFPGIPEAVDWEIIFEGLKKSRTLESY